MSARALYYNPTNLSAFSTLNKVSATLLKKNKSDIRAWLEQQESIQCMGLSWSVSSAIPTLCPTSWKCDLLDVQSLAKYNDMYRYILSVIDVFSKYLQLVPVKTKSGPSIFLSLFHDDDSRRPVWVRRDKGKEFLNKKFQDMLCDEGIQFQVCKNSTWNVRSWKLLKGRSEINFQIFFVQEFLPLYWHSSEICQVLKWHSSHDHRYNFVASNRFWRPRHMATDGGQETACSSRDVLEYFMNKTI